VKLRTAIVDDEPLARQLIRELLDSDPEVEIVAECGNGKQALAAVGKNAIELMFLDVQMPAMSGFDVLRAMKGGRMPYVIFVTAFDRYALRAFEVQAVDYLLKPFTRSRFHDSVKRAKQAIRNQELAGLATRMAYLAEAYADLQSSFDELKEGATPRATEFVVRRGRTMQSIRAADIRWIEAANQYVKLHTAGGSHLLARSLTALTKELDSKRFCRIHRSTIVNTGVVREVRAEQNGTCSVILNDGRELRMSRGRRGVLSALLKQRSG
jgi:two-component system LytT family response regulator